MDITPIITPQNNNNEDQETNFVEFLKNVQLYLQKEESPRKQNGDHFYKNLQFLRDKYKNFQKNKKGFNFDQFRDEFIENMQYCDDPELLLSADLRSDDYPMLEN